MSFRTRVLRDIILPLGDLAFGQQMISRLKFLEKAQYWTTSQILEKQSKDLQSLIKTAYDQVPFYRNLMDEINVKPEMITSPQDLRKLPIVTKDMLRKGYPHLTTRATGQKTYEASTSGSTGKNFMIREDAQTAGWYRATFLLQLEWTGWSIGVPHLQTGMTTQRSLDRLLKDLLLGCHYISAHKLDDSHLEHIMEVLDKNNLQYLWGYPGSLYYLAKFAIAHDWKRPLKAIASWGASLYPHYRKTIEQAFQTIVYDTYGCSEGIQIAAQCEFGNYHLHALDAVVEFLDDEGKAVKPGTVGNLVITRLHPGPMPLIRYMIGDMGIPSDEWHCQCGRNFPLMQSIQGRSGDIIITPSGNRLLAEYFCGILEHFSEIDSFQIIQESRNNVLLRIVPFGNITEQVIQEVIRVLQEKGAPDLDFSIEMVNEIPLPPTGKHRYIINTISS